MKVFLTRLEAVKYHVQMAARPTATQVLKAANNISPLLTLRDIAKVSAYSPSIQAAFAIAGATQDRSALRRPEPPMPRAGDRRGRHNWLDAIAIGG